MMKKYSMRVNVLFLLIFILVFNVWNCSANSSELTQLNYSGSYSVPIEMSSFENNPSEILSNGSYSRNGILWTDNILNFAAFLTSVVSLLTLNELRKQRNLASTPKLHIRSNKNSVKIVSKKIEDIGIMLPIEWESDSVKKTGEYNVFYEYSIPLQMINTGSSPALNVRIIWKYNHDTLKEISHKFNDMDIGIECELSASNSHFSVSDKKSRTMSFLNRYYDVDYVLPFSSQMSEYEILVPQIFSVFVSLDLAVYDLRLPQDDGRLCLIPIDFDVEYYDNINILHRERYSIEFDVFYVKYGYETDSKGEKRRFVEEAYFEIKTHKINIKQNRVKRVMYRKNK